MHKPGLFDDAPKFSGSHALRGNPADPRCGSVARRATAAFPRMPWEREEPSPLGTRLGKGYLFQLQSLLLLITLCLLSTPQLAKAATAVGATPGSFKVSETGAATYTIPLTVPPGTAGMAPSLSLNYNSQSGNGPLGMGWSLGGLSAIYRCPATIVQDGFKGGINYDASDRYCLDGQRLVVVSGSYGADGAEYRTETESYTRIVSFGQAGSGPASFKAWTKAGQIIEYGNTADSRIEAQGKATVRLWNVNKISDTKGNYIAASYTEDNANGEAYINRIDYTGNAAAGVAPYASVQFSYELKSDIEITYQVGSVIKSTKRTTNIKSYNGTALVKDYRFTYSSADISSEISGLTECDGNTICLPATGFNYGSHAFSFAAPVGWGSTGDYRNWNEGTGDFNGDGKIDLLLYYNSTGGWRSIVALGKGDGTFAPPVAWSGSGNYGGWNEGTGDFNGDGKTDLLLYYNDSASWRSVVALANGDGIFAPPVAWSGLGNYNGWNEGTGDFNGDGKIDLLLYYNDSTSWRSIVALANGDGTFAQPVAWSGPGNYNGWNEKTGDFNGDGKTDLFLYYNDISSWRSRVALAKGDGTFAPPVAWSAPGDYRNWHPGTGDFNGDGKVDLLLYYNDSASGWRSIVALAKDDGTFAPPVAWAAAGNYAVWNEGTGDFNGDGKTDLLLYYNDSASWRSVVALANGDGTFSPPVGWGSTGNYSVWPEGTGDFNGDGKTDLLLYYNDISSWRSVVASSNSSSRLLAAVTSGLGSVTTITYKPISDASIYTKDINAAYPYDDFQGSLYVVSQVQSSDGIGGNYATNYTYAGAKLHLTGGGFLGFRQVATNDPQTGITTTTTYSQNYPYQGLPQSVEKRSASGVLLNSAQNTWQNTAINGIYHRNDLIQTVEQSWDLNGAAMPRTKTNTAFDAYGNPVQITVATDDGYTAAGPVNPYGNVKTTTNTYFNDPVNWLLGRLVKASVTSTLANGTTATRTSAFVYASDSGLLIQETIEPDNANLKLVTDYTLDQFGNRVAIKTSGANIATRTSTTTFDAQGRFAIASTNALGHAETRTFNPGFGNPLSLTGPNGLTTYWAYDGFGRKTQESRADGTQSNFWFNFCTSNCPANAVYYMTATTSGAPTSNAYFDSLNREIRRETVGFDERVATVDKRYNNLGQVAATSRPYFPGETVYWTQFQYDILGRTVKIIEADGGVTQTAYNGLTASVTNALNHTTRQNKNGLGQVVQTVDAQGNSLAFTFDPFGNPLKTLDPKGNIITLAYDIRGRKTAMSDPDMGVWSYTYDTLGEMLTQTDAKGQTTTVSYDLLGRVVKRVEPDLTSVWTWDAATKGIGKLAAESSNNGFSRAYAYDNYGRLAQTTTTLGTSTYAQATLYDSFGRVARFVQPTGFSTLNVYNGNGYLAEVRDAASQKPFWQAQQVDASGRITLEKLGNNLYTQRTFDGMGRPTYMATGKFGVTPDIQNLYLNHDLNGNLTSRDDYAIQRGDSFVYDELDRLTSDLGPGGKILNYQYDPLGNITFKTDVGSYFYGAKPHAVTQITGNLNASLLYDANGNQTLGLNNRTVVYTAFNLPSKIVQGVNTVTFDYDANHERFRQTGPNGTTVYLNPRMDLGGHFEQTTAAGVAESRHTVYAGGKAIAEVVTRPGGYQQTRYFHADHLGSINAVTDDNAVVLARYAFDPFGARIPLYGDVNASRHGFTGHEHLPEVGLIHMNGRVYDPVLGRFLSADPQIQFPDNLQSYNRYSYVMNNPLVFTDPSGFGLFKSIGHFFSQVWHNELARTAISLAVMYFIPFPNPLISSFVGGLIQTGSVKGGLMGIANAVLSFGVGEITGHNPVFGSLDYFENIAGHAAVGCAMAAVQGGDCGSNALGAGFGAAVSPVTPKGIAGFVTATTVGGTASVIGGGRFANGAMTAAYGYLYNHNGSDGSDSSKKFADPMLEIAYEAAGLPRDWAASENTNFSPGAVETLGGCAVICLAREVTSTGDTYDVFGFGLGLMAGPTAVTNVDGYARGWNIQAGWFSFNSSAIGVTPFSIPIKLPTLSITWAYKPDEWLEKISPKK